MKTWIRKSCFHGAIAFACALMASHFGLAALAQVSTDSSTDNENQIPVAIEVGSYFEGTDLVPAKPVCQCWVSHDEMQRLELKAFESGFAVPRRDSFTSPKSNYPNYRAQRTATPVAQLKNPTNQKPTNRGLLQPILEPDLQPQEDRREFIGGVRRIPRPILDRQLRRASFQEPVTESQIESQIQNPPLELTTQPPAQPDKVEPDPTESEGSLIPDETSLEKLESQIKEQIELVSKESGDETDKQEQLQQLNSANSWIQKANNFQSLIEAQKKLENSFESRLELLQEDLKDPQTAEIPDPRFDSEKLQMELQVKRQELQQLKTQLSENQRKMEDRDKRIEQIPADRTAAQDRLGKYKRGLTDLNQQPEGTSKQLSMLILEAQEWAAKKEIEALSIESPRQEESGRLLPLERSLLSRKIQKMETEIETWSTAYNNKRDMEIVGQANDVKRLRQQVVDNDPGLNAWAKANQNLVIERESWTAGIEKAQTNLKTVTADREGIEASLNTLTQATQNDITSDVGISLVEQRHSLTLPWESQARIQSIRSKLKDIRLKNLGWQEERQKISSVETVVSQLRENRHEHGLSMREFESLANQLVESRIKLLDDLNEDYEVYRDVLVKEDSERVSLIKKISEMQKFIDEKALWIQSAKPIWEGPVGGGSSDLVKSVGGFTSLSQPAKWTDFFNQIVDRLARRPSESAFAGMVLFSLFVVSQRLREKS